MDLGASFFNHEKHETMLQLGCNRGGLGCEFFNHEKHEKSMKLCCNLAATGVDLGASFFNHETHESRIVAPDLTCLKEMCKIKNAS